MRERVRTSHEWYGWQGLKMVGEGEGQSRVCRMAGIQRR